METSALLLLLYVVLLPFDASKIIHNPSFYTWYSTYWHHNTDWVSQYTQVSTVLPSTTPSTVVLLGRDFPGVGTTSLLVLHAVSCMHRNVKHNFGHQGMSRWNIHVNCQVGLIAQLKCDIQSMNSNVELNCPHCFLYVRVGPCSQKALNHLVVTRVVLVLVLLFSFCHSLWQGLAPPLHWRVDTKGRGTSTSH